MDYHHLATACREPRGDLITSLRAAEINGKGFSEDELVKFCLLLLVAGQETVQNLLTNAIYCVTTYPESYAHLIQHPEDIPTAIEEVLRYLNASDYAWLEASRRGVAYAKARFGRAAMRKPLEKAIEAAESSAAKQRRPSCAAE